MPDNHRAYGEWNQERILNWSKTIGPDTYKYSSQTLERASGIIIEKNITPIHRNFKAVIESIQEVKEKENETNDYALVRGASYYGGYRND